MTNPNLNVPVDESTTKHPLSSGVRSSEFWVTVAALVLPFALSMSESAVNRWTAEHGWVGGLVAAVYVAARAYIKGSALRGPQ